MFKLHLIRNLFQSQWTAFTTMKMIKAEPETLSSLSNGMKYVHCYRLYPSPGFTEQIPQMNRSGDDVTSCFSLPLGSPKLHTLDLQNMNLLNVNLPIKKKNIYFFFNKFLRQHDVICRLY